MDEYAAPQIIGSDVLYTMNLPPIKYYVNGLLPQGLCLLAGDPKSGKSWLALAISLAIAEGRPVWGRDTIQCNVIYCCLEDSLSRVQRRMCQLIDHPVSGVYYMMDCMSIGDGLVEDLEYAMSIVPDVGVIIIDTLQRIRRGGKTTGNAYADDYEALTVLKQYADKHGIAVLCIHHTRKMKSVSDPMADISGTQGISGTADTLWVLKKKQRFADRATLYISGRDVESQQLELCFDKGEWSVDECVEYELVPRVIYDVIDYVTERGGWSGTSSELLEAIGETSIKPNEIGKLLVRYADTVLAEAGISYSQIRKATQRIVALEYLNEESDDGVTA